MDVQQNARIELPPDLEIGAHADAASVWHTRESFVIDFVALKKPPDVEQGDGVVTVSIDYRVSARIRIPPTHVIELMKALERELSAWETETGNRLPANPTEEAP